ncbi:hypothetical protein R6V09_05980 [Streptomyces sp. W16]|uniref:hypothetical protein n=1 Tax=Streptomyces sp. W16 TaxID=3076631 RepID=UPI00295B1A24|nr:hypothetical protein [Streptomyces sp. W16]MDV9169685.1 hypothetical protein [Streptomyces sp. W16]
MFFIVLVLLALIVGGAVAYGKRQAGGGSSRSGAGSAQQVYDADAGAEATRWVERLGGSLSTLDAGGNMAARQALADAAERHRAAEGQLAVAYSPMQYGLVTQTAVEGLHHIRTARAALGLDPGPELPAQGAGGQVTVGGQTYTASARPGANTPYYYPGGVVNGRSMAGGWYSTPWWKTALVAGAAGVGGMLLADALFDGFHHHGPGGGMFGGPGGFGGFGGPGGF